MTFAFPHLLWLALLPLAFLTWELTRRRASAAGDHGKILRAEAGPSSLRLAPPNAPFSALGSQFSSSRRARPWLCFGLACCVLAAARPQWGRVDEPVFDQSREILIAIDLSRSMLTPDIKPSRLERAKLLTQALLEKLTGERVGLVVFSGTAFLQSPLSADYEILREFLPALNPDFLPEGGTNYRALIDTSLAAFGATASADRFLIILSDGEATEDTWRDRIPDLKTKGIRVLALGVGTAGGAMIPDGSGGFVKDERGAVVLSKLEPATLRQLASSTGGVYADASTWIDLAGLINSTVEAGRKGQFMEKNSIRLVERFQWPLALGVWLLLVSFYYEFPVRPKPREIKLAGTPAARQAPAAPPAPPTPSSASNRAGPTATVAVLAFALLALAGRTSAFAETPAAPQPPPLSRIVTRLADSDRRTGRDWAEFAQETVNWGSRLQSAQPQQPVPEGPVHDALAAVDLGEKIDTKTADWPRLRRELEALLQKPPEQKPDQQKQDQPQQKQNQPQDQNQQNQQQKQDVSKQPDQQNQPPDSQKKDESRPDQNKSDSEKQQEQQREKQSAFGDMKDKPPPPPEETQKVGGTPEKKGEPPPADPSLAIPLQKLDQLKNQDSPAELFKLMEGEPDKTPRKKTKDW